MRKNARHARIVELVDRRAVRSQNEMAALLSGQGVEVAQATLSRDIRELGLVKVRGRYQSARAAAAAVSGPGADGLRRSLQRLVIRTGLSGNIVMVKTAPGDAHSLGVVLDAAEWPEVLGTVAGDDTVFVLLRGAGRGRRVLRRIEELQG